VFRFSKRPMTEAAAYPCQLSEKEKSRRSAHLRAALDRSRSAFICKLAGTSHRIIVENEYPVIGRAANFLPIEIPDARASRNTWRTVAIKGVRQKDGTCIAEFTN
jgi:tRNA A37 methylthiotransferase MiaB